MRKGDFSRAKVKGKRVLELGAGMGLGGIAFSMLGAEVVLTDTNDVLPLLRRNCESNLGCGIVTVAELGEEKIPHFNLNYLISHDSCTSSPDWFKPEQILSLKPPFDYLIAGKTFKLIHC